MPHLFCTTVSVLLLGFASVVESRQSFSPCFLPKPVINAASVNTATGAPTYPRRLLRSTTPSLTIRGGSSSSDSSSSGSSSATPTPVQEDTGLSWTSHVGVDDIPDTLVNKLDGSDTMRAKFEKLCRGAQVSN
jgi:hypothetical protein